MDAAIWGFIGTIVGAFASIGTSWLSSANSLKLQNRNAQDQRTESARSFQRQTLLELQEAIHDALRLVGRAHVEDYLAYKKSGSWGTAILSEEVNEGSRLAQRKVAILTERVTDESLRIEVKILMSIATQALLAKTQDEADGALNRAFSESTQVLERLGAVLRQHY